MTDDPAPDGAAPAAALTAAVCSIAPTRRRRFLWAAWWSGPPCATPFRPPDAHRGGARSREEALRDAERATGRTLLEIEPKWARAWGRIQNGEPPWFGKAAGGGAARPAGDEAREAPRPVWATLGVAPDASVEEIKRAFRRKALETHPDRGGSAEAFRIVQRAYASALRKRGAGRRGG